MAAIEKTTVLTSQGEQPDIVQRFLTNSALFIFLASSAKASVRLALQTCMRFAVKAESTCSYRNAINMAQQPMGAAYEQL